MSNFVVRDALTLGALEFFERTPPEPDRPLERFKVRLELPDLSAVQRVYAFAESTSPASLFSAMAASWRGWQGSMKWESLEGELRLRATIDRAGHVFLRVELRNGPEDGGWTVAGTVRTEAGRLETLKGGAEEFFGGRV